MKNVIKYAILCLIFTTSIISAHTLDKDSIVNIETEDDLKNLLRHNLGPSAISFHMKNCGWCIKMHPIFESLANNDSFEHVTFYRVDGPALNAHTHTKAITNEMVTGYPTIFFMNQGKLIDKQIGGTSQEKLTEKLTQLSSSSPSEKMKKAKQTKHNKSYKKKVVQAAASKIMAA